MQTPNNEHLAREAEHAAREMAGWGLIWVEERCRCGGAGGAMCPCEGQGRAWCPRELGMTPRTSDRLLVAIHRREGALRAADSASTSHAS